MPVCGIHVSPGLAETPNAKWLGSWAGKADAGVATDDTAIAIKIAIEDPIATASRHERHPVPRRNSMVTPTLINASKAAATHHRDSASAAPTWANVQLQRVRGCFV
jgi:hypothetical protein